MLHKFTQAEPQFPIQPPKQLSLHPFLQLVIHSPPIQLSLHDPVQAETQAVENDKMLLDIILLSYIKILLSF